jgi:hypothetical protein
MRPASLYLKSKTAIRGLKLDSPALCVLFSKLKNTTTTLGLGKKVKLALCLIM